MPEADAEECASDALYKAYQKIHLFREGKAKLTTWIYEIAKNGAIDFHRRQRVEIVPLDEATPAPVKYEYAGLNAGPLNGLKARLSELPEPDRLLLVWRAKDCSYADIGGWLGIKEGTARVRHKRLLEKLKVTLRQAAEDEIPTEVEVSEDE